MFVGNLSYETTQTQLTELFATVGDIRDVYLPSDRNTGRPRGFAFVEYSSDEEAEEAIEKFNDYDLAGRKLRVNAAEERPRRRPPMPPPGGFERSFGPDAFGGGRPAKPKGSRRGRRGKKRSL